VYTNGAQDYSVFFSPSLLFSWMIKVIGAWAFRCGLREKGPQEFIISEKAKGGE
jgi:hypothetical protein